MVAAVVGEVSLRTAMSTVVEAVSAIACLVEFLRKVVIAPLVLTKAVDDHNDRFDTGSSFCLDIKLSAVERIDDAFTHMDTSCKLFT